MLYNNFYLLPPYLFVVLYIYIYIYIHVLSRIGHYWPAAPVARLKNTYQYQYQYIPSPNRPVTATLDSKIGAFK